MEIRPVNDNRMAPPSALPSMAAGPVGGFVEFDGEAHYCIRSFNQMPPFFISIPSDTDLWMFIASGGGLTCGRVDSDGSLFPYRTVDQLHESHHHTGPVTLFRVEREGKETVLWEPFLSSNGENPTIERSLLKNATGNRLVFEETHSELEMTFRYTWSACDEFGWVRTSTLENTGTGLVQVQILDGLRNILPFGASLGLYQKTSNLVDAYKKTEVDSLTGLGIFSLTAGITDRAEALEVLRANTVWCCGFEEFRVHISLDTISDFRHGRVLAEEHLQDGGRGNYLITSSLEIPGGDSASWHLIGDTGRDHMQIAQMRRMILDQDHLYLDVANALKKATTSLRRNVASADGLQISGRPESWAHHFANVLFNNMRGGVFSENYLIPTADLVDFLAVRNTEVLHRCRSLFNSLPEKISVQDLHDRAALSADADLQRLCLEYLPLYFGRRHGDPSRPWNKFSINVRDRAGDQILHYEGNWRDIFQNWEALATAFPGFLPNMVAKFVNASTVDGYNPYRINRDGLEWEAITEDDPWSNIGYWGDHQIIYLLKLLEAWKDHDPGGIENLLHEPIFSYAEVPYRIKPYAYIVGNPSETIDFDSTLDAHIAERVKARGTDGKLVTNAGGGVHHGILLEKLLVPALAKLSNLVPDAGIWMNTQRPEWNDANNALAGGGVSVVTLNYLRRYMAFLNNLLDDCGDETLPVANEIVEWLEGIIKGLEDGLKLMSHGPMNDRGRKTLLDILGKVFDKYRSKVYASGFSGTSSLSLDRVRKLCETSLKIIDLGLAANRRDDGLFHTYNLLQISEDGTSAKVVRLQQMLEGQVAALSSGLLKPAEALDILEKLYDSGMYREDLRTFMLYPERKLPNFLAKNVVPEESVKAVPLLRNLEKMDDQSLVARDANGIYRFAGTIGKADDVKAILDRLGQVKELRMAVNRDRDMVLELFESVFNHKSYTGRSGTMYGYEGLGCIYWHMVAKLLLAVQENVFKANDQESSTTVRHGLQRMYFRVRSGLGYERSAPEFGTFPTDPYSHTPTHGGAKQPGMTGQVKEEILTRRGELGISVKAGCISFQPSLLRAIGFLRAPTEFHYTDLEGTDNTLQLQADSLAFTLCQTPVVYEESRKGPWLKVTFTDGTDYHTEGSQLDQSMSSEIFGRTGRIKHILAGIPSEWLGQH